MDTYTTFIRDWWRIENGKRIPYPNAPKEYINSGLTYNEAIEACKEYNLNNEPGEVSRKMEFIKE